LTAPTKTNFLFEPTNFLINLGDKEASFKIGCSKLVTEGLYPITLSKRESGFG